MVNKSKIAREFWRAIFKENKIDLRNSDIRKSVVSDFIQQNKGWNNTTDRRFFRLAFDKVSKEFGTSTSAFGVKPEQSRTKKTVGSLGINVKSDEKKVHPLFSKKEAEKKPINTQIPNAQQLQEQQMAVQYSSQSIAAIFDTMMNIMHSRFPAMSKLSEAEKTTLGDSWLPIFNEYFQTGSKWILPAIVTIPIILVRFSQHNVAKKQKDLEEKYGLKQEPEPVTTMKDEKSNWSKMNFEEKTNKE